MKLSPRTPITVLVLFLGFLAFELGPSVAHAGPPVPPLQKKGVITQAQREAAATRLQKQLKSAGKSVRLNSRMVAPSGARAGTRAIDLGVPDYFGTIPNYALSPLPPSVTIAGDGSGAVATVTVNPDGTLGGFTVISGGSGYTMADVNVIGGGGIGATGTATLANGAIVSVKCVCGGSGYTSPPVVTINDPTGTGATATATLSGDVVSGITVTAFGSNYTAPTVTFSGGGGGSGACATATKADGVITSIAVSAAGAGYNTVPGIRKFVDSLPGVYLSGVNTVTAADNNLGQYIPVAVPQTMTINGIESDYYEIELDEYTKKLHSDLPPTKLRGYRQTNTSDPAVSQFSYLGPIILAQRDRAVRIKFTNHLPTGAGGNLFLPVDTTVMGAGMGPLGMNVPVGTDMNYSENRATLHLHGGFVPWISDGTPHQWVTPVGETTAYPKGVSVVNVPDMPNPGDGSMTFYYNNQQSARLQFYHDHSYGITRLNVYGGEAAGYLITDQIENDLIYGTDNSGVNPGHVKLVGDVTPDLAGLLEGLGVPLVIQDKTFVPSPNQLAAQDPTWSTTAYGGYGNLWMPHVYMPNQNPADASGMNAMGRWHYGPWFWPPTTNVAHPPIPNPLYDCGVGGLCTRPWENALMPDTPNPTQAMEAFMDTIVVNGTAYPYLDVQPKRYRFRILSVGNDRFFNLQLYVADPSVTTSDQRTNTEVKMVPAVATDGFPAAWPTDGRDGGVPDPATRGPAFVQLASEGGWLPAPVVIPNQPVNWNLDQTNFDFGNVNRGALLLGPAERADVIVDFSKFAGKTLILYNDSPAPFPAIDPRYDYRTGGPDLTDTGGAPTVLAGFGPNTRTVMQIRVAAGPDSSAPADYYDPAFFAAIQSAFAKTAGKPGIFESSQDPIIVPSPSYNSAYNQSFPNNAYLGIGDWSKTFQTVYGTTMTKNLQPKAIQDEQGETFDEYGRMSAILGLQIPGVPGSQQNLLLYGYASPPVDLLEFSMTPMTQPDATGTQIWRITHNGVDTHTLHFHLFNVQLINRVAWDNAMRYPDPNELGWKETLRVNPLQDTFVAMRPSMPTQPFDVPNSVRPIDPTMPLGVELAGMAALGYKDPQGNPVAVINHLVNYGWEYVMHCHLLGHEEMDMMHSVGLAPSPTGQGENLVGAYTAGRRRVNLTWTDSAKNESHYLVQRSINTQGPWTEIGGVQTANGVGVGATLAYTDTTVARNTTYYYRVIGVNIVGDMTTYSAPAIGFPQIRLNTGPSNQATVSTGGQPAAPLNLAVGLPPALPVSTRTISYTVNLIWTDPANDETGFRLERSTLSDFSAYVTSNNVPSNPAGGTTAFQDVIPTGEPLAPRELMTYYYRVFAVNDYGDSNPSNVVTHNVPLLPPGTNKLYFFPWVGK